MIIFVIKHFSSISMKRFTFVFLIINIYAGAQTPTWSDKIAKIIYNNCTECHRTGGIAPFTLENYSDTKANAFGIKTYTGNKTMPPWKADPTFNHHKGERLLTDQQITDLSDWVTGGMPSGDLSQAPIPPVFPSGINMQNPDKTITIPAYSIIKNTDDYRCFVIPSGLISDKFLSQVEFEPMNRGVVHHILLFQDNATTCLNLDNADPLPGYSSSGGGIGSNTATLISGWVPGGTMTEIPQGMGIRLKANCYYILQIHYAPGSVSKKDSTRCHFKYSALTSPREVYVSPLLNHFTGINGGLTNGPLFIPANTIKSFNQEYDLDNSIDYSLISVTPHQHYLGQSYKIFATTPAMDTIKLCYIPHWDFRWQSTYIFQKVLKIPKGSKIFGFATYDNTTNNLFNPSSPPKNVGLGENTTDEMMISFFTFTVYFPGDENIILDSSILKSNGITLHPPTPEFNISLDPGTGILSVTSGENEKFELKITDINGKILELYPSNESKTWVNMKSYGSGIYLVHYKSKNGESVKKFVTYR